MVRNEAARYYRRPHPQPLAEPPATEGYEDDQIQSAPMRADIAAAMLELSGRAVLLLKLRYEEDLTQAMIARLLEMPEGTVKVSLSRARAQLRRALRRP